MRNCVHIFWICGISFLISACTYAPLLTAFASGGVGGGEVKMLIRDAARMSVVWNGLAGLASCENKTPDFEKESCRNLTVLNAVLLHDMKRSLAPVLARIEDNRVYSEKSVKNCIRYIQFGYPFSFPELVCSLQQLDIGVLNEIPQNP